MNIEELIKKSKPVVKGEGDLWFGILQQLSQYPEGNYYLVVFKKGTSFLINGMYIISSYKKEKVKEELKKYLKKAKFEVYKLNQQPKDFEKNIANQNKYSLLEILMDL